MEKRLILAIALTFLVLLSWSALVGKFQPLENKEVKQVGEMSKQNIPLAATPIAEQEYGSSSLLSFTKDNLEFVFIEPLAVIKEIIFKAHQNHSFSLRYGLLIAEQKNNFKKGLASGESITFTYADEQKKIIKKFNFLNTNYIIELEINTQNISSAPLNLNLPLVLGRLDFSAANEQMRYQDVFVSTKEKSQHLNGRKSLEWQNIKFLGLRDRYFCIIVQPETDAYTGFIRKVNPQESEVGLHLKEVTLAPGQQIGQKFQVYIGPQDAQLINSLNPDWTLIVNYGTFDFISQILLQTLRFLYGIVHNWGWAILILSLLVYLVLFPLSLKQMRSLKEMQALQPKIEELRRIHKDNPQRLNKEIMELYREHKVNPFGGCLPLILQMPIFLALYQALMRSVVLKGSNFLWIKDLSEPDRLFLLPVTLPILGNEINILPIVMTIGALVQQKFSAVNTGGTSAQQQKLMTLLFPIMIGVIFYHMPAGLVLYWLINSLLMLTHQIYIARKK